MKTLRTVCGCTIKIAGGESAGFSVRERVDGEALRGHIRKTNSKNTRSRFGGNSRKTDFIQDIKLFFCSGNDVLSLPLPRLVVLDCGPDEDLYDTGVCDCIVFSWALWTITGISDVVDLSILSFAHVIIVCSSTAATDEKQKGKLSSPPLVFPSFASLPTSAE